MKNKLLVRSEESSVITFDELPATVVRMYNKLETIEKLLKQRPEAAVSDPNTLMVIQQAAEFLHLSVPTIYGLVSSRGIPFMKKGKRLYFSKNALMTWLESSHRKQHAV